MPWTNYHSHSHFCDGKLPPEDHVKSAIEKGMKAFGFSSHAPVSFPAFWAMDRERLDEYLQLTRQLKEDYADQIQLYVSLEVDYIPGIIDMETDYIQAANLDYKVGSVHYVGTFADGRPWEIDGTHQVFLEGLKEIFQGDVRAVIEQYFALNRQMMEAHTRPEVVGHIDKVKMQSEGGKLFDESADWYREAFLATLETARAQDCVVELNTRGSYKKRDGGFYPSEWALRQMHTMGIPICLNSDSHHPEEVCKDFTLAAECLVAVGYQELMVLWEGEWQARPFTKDGIRF